MSIKNIIRGGLFATVATVALAGSADAAVKAYANLSITNFQITISPASTSVAAVISSTNSTATSNSGGSLLGTHNLTDTNGASAGAGDLYDAYAQGIGDLSAIPAAAFTGTYTATHPNYTTLTPGSFVFSDSYLKALNVSGGQLTLSPGTLPGTSVSTTSDASTDAQAQQTGGNYGTTHSDSNVQSNGEFQVSEAATIGFSFDFLSTLVSQVEAGDVGSANATNSFQISIDATDGSQSFAFTLGSLFDLSTGTSNFISHAPGLDTATFGATGLGVVVPFTFDPTKIYNLVISQTSIENTQRLYLPEPMTLGLMGLGLAGLGAIRRRK